MSNILIPLYVYPAPGAWDPLHRIIERRPDLSFTVIVNPNNGPSVPGLNGRPDDNYIRELKRLNGFRLRRKGQRLNEPGSNSIGSIGSGSKDDGRIRSVRIIGYVATAYGQRPFETVKRDIETYASWSTLGYGNSIDGKAIGNDSGTAIQGIFFDETPNNYDADTAMYLASLHAVAKEHSSLSEGFVVDNPGCLPDERLYDKNTFFDGEKNNTSNDGSNHRKSFADLADLIVIFEDSYATFNSRLQSGEFARLSPKSPYAAVAIPREKRACIVHSVPTASSNNTPSIGSPSFTKFLTSLSSKSSSSSLKKKKALSRDVGGPSDVGGGNETGAGRQVEDRQVEALGRALAGLAGTIYVTDVKIDYYAKFSGRMEVLCGPWNT